MSVVKKYNKSSDSWDIIASGDASGIYTNNGLLTDKTPKSIEDILIEQQSEIDLLQHNVSWLALHGGGGSGAGGGADISASISVLSPTDDETPVTNLVWNNDINHLIYKFSSNTKTTFTVTVKLNNRVIQTDTITEKNKKVSISIQTINRYIGTGGTLSITAVDPSESEFSTRCSLSIAQVTLNDSELRVTSEQLQSHGTYPLRLSYKSNTIGRYKLYYSNTMIYVRDNQILDQLGNNLDGNESYISISIGDDKTQSSEIDVVDKELVDINSDPGTYNKYFILVSEDDINIRSAVASAQIIVTITNGILVVSQIGSDELNPYTIHKDGILPLQFIVYSNNIGTYEYSIFIDGYQIGSAVSGNIFNQSVLVQINISNYQFIEEGQTYEIEIRAKQGAIIENAFSWISVLQPNAKLLSTFLDKLNQHTIFDFTFYNRTKEDSNDLLYANNNYFYRNGLKSGNETVNYGKLTTNLNFKNVGVDSGASSSIYYRLTHLAYGEITTNTSKTWFPKNSTDNNSLIGPYYWGFTLQIAYYIGNEERDDPTILNMGNYDITEGTGNGIVITSHNFYIKLENTTLSGELEDNSFTQLDIVVSQIEQDYLLQVYQNAKLLAATPFKINQNGGGSDSINSILLAGKEVIDGELKNNINVDIYSIKFLSTALNVGEIVSSYINNYVTYNRTDQGLSSELLSEMCLNNQISQNEDSEKISTIYDFQTGEYTWNISAIGNEITLPDALLQLPIPIVMLSVDWTFDEFTSTSISLEPSLNSKFVYREKGKQPIESFVEVSIQGTTSASYNIKNVNIKFEDGILFSPKDTWFPESTFTLKADVVDSGHINNAVIGKFINDCFIQNPSSLLMNVEDCFPTVRTVKNLQNRAQLPPNLTVKATIEGFPCLLVINFKKNEVRDPRILGIYSFNLGRESYYNQGYKVPNHLYPVGSNQPYASVSSITFPNLFGDPGTDVDLSSKGYCFEGQASHNCSIKDVDFSSTAYDYVLIDNKYIYPVIEQNSQGNITFNSKVILDDNENEIPYSSERIQKKEIVPDGYFWSDHDSYSSNILWDFKGDNATVNVDDARKKLKELNTCIATKIPYTKGNIRHAYDKEIPQYQLTNIAGESITTAPTGSTVKMVSVQSPEPTELSIKNTAFYYVIAMLFGLVDSLGKNMQLKFWSSNCDYWSPTFYDMDTALGISNTGEVSVPPTVLDYSMFNTQDHKLQLMYGKLPVQDSSEIFTVWSNKIFGIENVDFVRQYSQDFSVIGGGNDNLPSANFYAQMWNNLRTTVLIDSDKFFETYFAHQFDGCGELLMNYDYEVKYINTAQLSYLHGDRLSFIKNWLKKRITFLDSVFGYCQRKQNGVNFSLTNYLRTSNYSGESINSYNVSWNNQIRFNHNSGTLTLPIITNKSVIVKTIIGGVNETYTYVPAGVETEIVVAENLSTPNIQTIINNSDCIIDLPNLQNLNITNIVPISGITVYNLDGTEKYSSDITGNLKTQFGTFSSLRNFNLSGVNTIANNLDFFQLFKSWDISPLDKNPEVFGIQTLDLSNMKSTNGKLSVNLDTSTYESNPNVPETYKNPFVNLLNINVSESDITDVNIPTGVSLYSLTITNSKINRLTLKDQPLLKNISFNGCGNLSSVTIINCENITELNFNSSNVSLTTIEISDCENLKSFKISGSSSIKQIPIVRIQNCKNLESIEITGCVRVSNTALLTIEDCEKLKVLNLYNSKYKEISWDKKSNLDTLNLRYTNVSSLHSGTINNNIVDLTGLSTIQNFTMQNNEEVQYVKFDNIKDKPFEIKQANCFRECSKLLRVYGNITLNSTYIFYNSSKFSVLGTETTTYNGVSMVDENGIVKHFHETQGETVENGKPKFQEGEEVTNITLVGTETKDDKGNITGYSVSNCFFATSCTKLDAYYILYNIGESVTHIQSLFYNCKKISWNFENSPSRYIFKNCSKVKYLNALFRDTDSSSIRLFSPTEGNDDGIFSPLIEALNISQIFYSTNVIIDRNIFRRYSGKYKIKTLSYFYVGYVVDDILKYNSLSEVTESLTSDNIKSDINSENPILGNLGGLFNDCPNLTNINLSFSPSYINYDFFKEDPLNIPGILTSEFKSSFITANAYGTIDSLSNLFKNPRNVKYINAAFINRGSLRPKLIMSNDLLKQFNSLIEISNFVATSDPANTTFSFTGFDKVILENEFPYQIIQNNPNKSNIIALDALFKDCSFNDPNSNIIQLPKNIFNGCKKLQKVSELFYNINFDYELTSNGFKDCVNLQDVSKMFAVDTSTRRINHLTGSIPNKLFYHGGKNVTKTIIGVNESQSKTQIKVDSILDDEAVVRTTTDENQVVKTYTNFTKIDDTHIECNPLTQVYIVTTTQQEDENGNIQTIEQTSNEQFGSENRQSININYFVPNSNISDISYCFQGANIDYYTTESYQNSDVEILDTYQPFDYILNNGIWERGVKSLQKKTLMWIYDGDYNNYISNLQSLGLNSSEFEFLDDAPTDATWGQNIYYLHGRTGDVVSNINSGHFCCSPDLLRYCTSTSNISGLFYLCGQTAGYVGKWNHLYELLKNNYYQYGLKGRIVPYLLKPVFRTENLTEMFTGCKLLGWYLKDNLAYTIPESFLSYLTGTNITLVSTFKALHFPREISLNVFKGKPRIYNVTEIFRYCTYDSDENNYVTISDIFNDNNIQVNLLKSAFRVSENDSESDYGDTLAQVRRIYVNFLNNFKKFNNTDAWYVYDGYTENTVYFGENRELPTEESNRNYRTVRE